ncbi:unnamed protein product [Pedinophyceae sp. YPF-701]|nr:unnamed protein product [Pedinophyceae sp. YPF-701]
MGGLKHKQKLRGRKPQGRSRDARQPDAKRGARRGGAGAKTPQELFAEAQDRLELGDVEGALKLMAAAYKAGPGDLEIADAYGALLAESGGGEAARAVLMKSVEQSPDDGHEKYMYLGQLSDAGDEAVRFFEKGVAILEAAVASAPQGGSGDDGAEDVRAALASALCSLAEQLVANAQDADEPGLEAAAPRCLELLDRATQLHPATPEPLQARASIEYELGRTEDALKHLRESMARWYKPRPGQGAEGGADDLADDLAEWDLDPDAMPSYEFRFECAKLLLELDSETATAISVLEGLLAEQDMDVNVWYLLTLAYYSGGDFPEARECMEHGAKLCAKLGADEAALEAMWGELRSALEEGEKIVAAKMQED